MVCDTPDVCAICVGRLMSVMLGVTSIAVLFVSRMLVLFSKCDSAATFRKLNIYVCTLSFYSSGAERFHRSASDAGIEGVGAGFGRYVMWMYSYVHT